MELDPGPKSEGKRNLRLQIVESSTLSSRTLEARAIDLNDKSPVKIHVEGVWTQNPLSSNSIIHLVNPIYNSKSHTYSVDNSHGFLVLDPDSLLTCTYVASSLFCERKTWLNHVFLGAVGTNRAMLVGSLVHETFQYGVKNKITDIEKLVKFLDEQLDDATVMLEINSVDLHIKDIRDEAISYMKSIKEWIEKYLLVGPKFPLTNDANLEVKITAVQDIEENVWSTKYGLKGKIDVTGSVRIHNKATGDVSDKVIPLELKTGNPNLSASHAAQVSLYSMMIEDRYAETNQGFVIYLKDRAAMHNVALTHNIKRDLIQRRNRVNLHMKNYYVGPDMIDQPRICSNCERLTECVLMSNSYTPGKIDQFPSIKRLEMEAIGHLEDKFFQFFLKYHEKLANIMTKVSSVDKMNKSEEKEAKFGSFWNYSSEEAELKGTGFGKLQATSKTNDKMSSSFITFKRHPKYLESLPYNDVDEKLNGNSVESDNSDSGGSQKPAKKQKIAPSQSRINDFFIPIKRPSRTDTVMPSKKTKRRPFDVKIGAFSRCRVAVSLDSGENINMNNQNSTTAIAIGFISEMTGEQIILKIYEGAMDTSKPEIMYRLDKIEKRTNVDIERVVLARMMSREDPRSEQVRQLIFDPKIEPKNNILFEDYVLEEGMQEVVELDKEEQKAVVRSVATDNYFVLNEVIGIKRENLNKTVTTLTKLILDVGRDVLIVGTHIDSLVNLMNQLQSKRIKFIIVDDGQRSTEARFKFQSNFVKVPQIESLALDKKYESYIKQHESAKVVITTYAMSIGGLQFARRIFEYCICYECDKIELLLSLSPMFSSQRYIIVDIRDEHDENGCDRTKTTGEQNITLGEHLRSLRPSLYQEDFNPLTI